MTEKFTQGEWRVRRYKDDPNFDLYDYLVVETVADEPLGIAAMFQRNDIESEANAALIAAAPDLFECVCDALTDLQMPEGMRNHFEAVLKKARGEE